MIYLTMHLNMALKDLKFLNIGVWCDTDMLEEQECRNTRRVKRL